MTLTTLTMERAHHAAMDGDTTPPERPVRRTFTAAYKARILAEYEAAVVDGSGGAASYGACIHPRQSHD